MLDLQDEIKYKLGEIDGKMDLLQQTLNDFKDDYKDQDMRIRGLEAGKNWIWGAGSVVSVVVGFIILKLKEHNII